MKLTRVHLHDFRCFEDATFDLTKPGSAEPLEVALLVGGNGSGKTAFIQAVSGFFTGIAGRGGFDYGGRRIWWDDVRRGAQAVTVEINWRDLIGDPPCAKSIHWVETHRGIVSAESPPQDDRRAAVDEWALWTAGAWRPTGLIVALDVYRLLPPTRVDGPNLSGVVTHRCDLALAPTIAPDGALRRRSQQLKQWIVNLDYRHAKAKADRNEVLPLWDTLRHALNTLLRPYTFEGVDDNFQVIFQTPWGHVALETLSDGFLSVFVIIAELLLRLSFSTLRQEDILTVEAVCMVDEIDAHLHPRWQENVIPGLRAMFPNVQFIATTHSPIVVASVEPENVFRLEQEDP